MIYNEGDVGARFKEMHEKVGFLDRKEAVLLVEFQQVIDHQWDEDQSQNVQTRHNASMKEHNKDRDDVGQSHTGGENYQSFPWTEDGDEGEHDNLNQVVCIDVFFYNDTWDLSANDQW